MDPPFFVHLPIFPSYGPIFFQKEKLYGINKLV